MWLNQAAKVAEKEAAKAAKAVVSSKKKSGKKGKADAQVRLAAARRRLSTCCRRSETVQEHVYNTTAPTTCLPHTGFAGAWTPSHTCRATLRQDHTCTRGSIGARV